MSRLPRHPRLWPRMKMRGRRRRALAEQRHELTHVYPRMHVVGVTRNDDGTTEVEFRGGPPPAAGAATATIVQVIQTTDGLGRQVPSRHRTDVVLGTDLARPKPAAPERRKDGRIMVAPAGTDEWQPLGELVDSSALFTPSVTHDVTPLLTFEPSTVTLEITANPAELRRHLLNEWSRA